MFAKLLTVLMACTFALQASANDLKNALDEFTYSMEVEGAVFDSNLQTAAVKKLNHDLDILRNQGLTNKALILEAVSRVENSKAKSAIDQEIALLDLNNLSAEASVDLLNKIASNSRSQGASWNGSTALQLTLGLVGLTAVMFGIMYVVSQNESCPTNYSDSVCAKWDNRHDEPITSWE